MKILLKNYAYERAFAHSKAAAPNSVPNRNYSLPLRNQAKRATSDSSISTISCPELLFQSFY